MSVSLYIPVVASVVMQPQALHWTSVLSLDKREMSGWRALACTIVCLFLAGEREGERGREREGEWEGEREREGERGREREREERGE